VPDDVDVKGLEPTDKEKITRVNEEMAEAGLRVYRQLPRAVAKAIPTPSP